MKKYNEKQYIQLDFPHRIILKTIYFIKTKNCLLKHYEGPLNADRKIT